MSGIKTLLLYILASGVLSGLLAVSAKADCMPPASTGSTPIGGENDAAETRGTAAADSPTSWQTEPGETEVMEHRSRIVVSHVSLGCVAEEMLQEGFRSGHSLMVALENLRSDLADHRASSAAYLYPSDDCELYAQAADGRPDPTRPVAALWWPETQGGCRALKELIGVVVADHMDGIVLEARAAANEYVRESGLVYVSFEPAPISFAWLFVAYHNVDVSKLPAELGFVDRLAERLQTASFPYHIQDRDTLSHLALALTGVAGNYAVLHALNREVVSDPNMIVNGETIAMPPDIANWTIAFPGEDPAATSSRLYGTPIFASTVAGLCGGETTSTEHPCVLPIWHDSIADALAEATDQGFSGPM